MSNQTNYDCAHTYHNLKAQLLWMTHRLVLHHLLRTINKQVLVVLKALILTQRSFGAQIATMAFFLTHPYTLLHKIINIISYPTHLDFLLFHGSLSQQVFVQTG